MNQDFTPSDQANRSRIEQDLEATFFVEAGAGTGKTKELVDRITNLVANDKTSIDRIAAITFTEAAAAELRDRVRTQLEKSILDASKNETQKDMCQTALDHFDDANIQTLHSFAASLLRERPFDAGLPPNFEVVTEMEAGIEFQENWQRWIDEAMGRDEIASHLLTAMSFGLKLDDLKTAARLFQENYDRLPEHFEMIPFPKRQAANRVVSETVQIRILQSLANNGADDPLCNHAEGVCRLAEMIIAVDPGSDAGLSLLAGFGKISFRSGSQKDWGKAASGENACTELKKLLGDLEDVKNEELEAVRRAALMILLEDLRASMITWIDRRRNAGKVHFQDLLVQSRNMLRDMPDVRRHFQQRFSYILIDEFQDTDPIQAEIAFFLAADSIVMGEGAFTEKDWKKLSIAPGKLFVVGDPKQSIYRFRRADIAIVQQVMDLLGTDKVLLEQNFRSQEPIIAWVNGVFSNWMGEGKPSLQAAYANLSARWNNEDSAPPMGVHYFGEAIDEPAAELKRREAFSIAGIVSNIKNAGWLVRENSSGAVRPAQYSDICILMPTRNILPNLERSLDEAQIPYRVESESFVLGTQDVRELLNCLRAIDSPADHVALVAALRSTAFGCSDVELLDFIDRGGLLDYTNPGKGEGPVRDALTVLAKFNHERMWIPIDELIETFIRDRQLAELSFSRPRPRERLRRLKLVVEQARAFSRLGEGSLRVFADWMDQQMADGSRMVEIPVPEVDEDAVRIMTVHASKGLEFPVVILAGIGSVGPGRSSPVIFERDGNNIQISLGNESNKFITSGYEEAKAFEKEADDEETIRLMYVATTRAKDHLVLSLFHKATKGESKALPALISKFVSESVCNWHDCSEIDEAEIPESKQERARPSDTLDDREQWIFSRKDVLKKASRKSAIAVTKLAHSDKEEAEWGEVYFRKGRSGTNLGRAVHSVLQSIDLATGAGLKAICKAQADNEGITNLSEEVTRIVKNALNTGVVKRAVASGKYYRELFTSLPLGNGLVEGYIDLLFEEAGEIVIADYKTDKLLDKIELERMGQYRLQASTYALAVSEITGKSVKEVVLVFASAGKEISITDFSDLNNTIREKAAALFQ